MRNQFLTVTLPIGLAVVGASAIISHGQNSRYGVPIMAPADARTPIHESDMPLVIDEPGSYYFAENIVTGECGITIASNNVTIDLNGFTLERSQVSVCGDSGIATDGPRFNIRVHGGMVAGWGEDGIFLEGTGHTVENVVATRNARFGVYVESGLIKCVQAHRNANHGIGGSGPCVVDRCIATGNGHDGISCSGVVTASAADDNTGHGIHSQGPIAQCWAANNGEFGVFSPGSASIVNCSARSNGQDGFNCNTGVLSVCSAFANDRNGIRGTLESLVIDSVASFNGRNDPTDESAGFYAEDDGCFIRGNLASRNVNGVSLHAVGCTVAENFARVSEMHDLASFVGLSDAIFAARVDSTADFLAAENGAVNITWPEP